MMYRALVIRGATGGIVAGIAMAMWSMILMWLSGSGFWTPLNLIAHTFWRDAPLDGSFSLGAMVISLVVHMMMSGGLGAVLALLLGTIGRWAITTAGATAIGAVFGVVVWLVMQFVVWRLVDPAAAERFTPWVFAIGHVIYGVVTGLAVGSARTSTRTMGSPGAR